MTGTPPGWVVKIERAHEHVASLQSEIEDLQVQGKLDLRTEEAEGGRIRRVFMVHPEAVPSRLSAVVGDALHNARSALDCIVVALATAGAGRRLDETEEAVLQFPVTRSVADFNEQRKKRLQFVDAEAVEVIRSHQPFVHAEVLEVEPGSKEWEHAVQRDPLQRLHRLSIVDKHRRIHLGVWHPKDMYMGTPPGTSVTWFWAGPPWPSSGYVGYWLVEGDIGARLDQHGSVTLALRQDVETGMDLSVLDRLTGLIDYVEHRTLPALISFLEQAPKENR